MCNRIGKVSRKQTFVYVICTSKNVEVKYGRISCSQVMKIKVITLWFMRQSTVLIVTTGSQQVPTYFLYYEVETSPS
jgi:hypothetical protein